MTGRKTVLVLLCVCLIAVFWPAKLACSAEPGDAPLYTADAIVTGTDMRQRPWGFAQCLKEVLVKVSGDPNLKDDPRVAAMAEHADRLAAGFGYVDLMAGIKRKDDQGSYDRPHRLTVHFDPAKIDDALARFGDKPWRGERPVVVPVLLVFGPNRPPYLLSAGIPAGEEQRGAFAEAASEFGMTVRFPSDSELSAWGTAPGRLPSSLPASSPAEAIVAGTLDWNETLPGWVGKWRVIWDGREHRWGVSGLNYDAAFRHIVRGVVLLASGRGPPD